ncbi:MAG: hypothetical protein ACKVYV_02650 [Limisphaerales bacterium]
MRVWRRRAVTALLAAAWMLPGPSAWGLVLRGGPINTNPPAGRLAGSGWDFIGRFESGGAQGFAATPIAHRVLLTARHLGFAAGDVFRFQGQDWTVTERVDIAQSDLALGLVAGTFPGFAPLQGETNEVGAACVLFGPGLIRGDPVHDADGALRGWRWAAPVPAGLRWGTNVVARTLTVTNAFGVPGEVELLAGDFVAPGGDELATWAVGDSGSPLFIATPHGWRLAGVASAVDGPFTLTDDPGETPFDAALFDGAGLWLAEPGVPRVRLPTVAGGNPTSWYASRIAPHLARLREVIAATGGAPAIRIEGGRVSGEFAGAAGQGYDVQSSPDAGGPWTLLEEVLANAEGWVPWSDDLVPGGRLYRAVPVVGRK